MIVNSFIQRLIADNQRKKNTHKLSDPVSAEAVEKWCKRHPEFGPLPKPFVEFLQLSDGVIILRDKHALAEVGGRLRLLGLKKLDSAMKIMFDGEEPDDDDSTAPHLLGLGWDDNHDWSPLLDTKTGEVRIASHGGERDSDEVLDSFEAFLDWVAQTILDPHDQDLAAEAAAKGKAKSKKKSVVHDLVVEKVFDEPKSRLLGLSVCTDGRRAITCGHGAEHTDEDPSIERTLRLWDLLAKQQERVLDLPRYKEHRDARQADGTFKSWWSTRETGLAGGAISPDGRVVAVSVLDCDYVPAMPIMLFDADSGQLMRAVKGGTRGTVRFSPNGSILLTAGGPYGTGDGVIHLCDAKTLEPIAEWDAHKPHTVSAIFTPDGTRIISSGWNKVIKIWEVPSGKLIEELPRQRTPIVGLAISRDGARLALGSFSDRVVRVMELSSRQVVAELPGHNASTQGLDFSPDGTLLATIDGRGAVRVWEVATANEIARFIQPEAVHYVGDPPGTGVAFLPDGKTLISCGWDRFVRLLRLP